MRATAYIGLGSNLGDRAKNITAALALLGSSPGIRLRQVSPLQVTKPIGPIKQPDFLNGVAFIETLYAPVELLDLLLNIEKQLGRVRIKRWGPRTIDLDVILYGNRFIDHPRLRVPHPELEFRSFWLDGLNTLRHFGGCSVN
jgi:2-amino-4-hydroxy-6-hydroxymethyldihydropteridine diphosphokinase